MTDKLMTSELVTNRLVTTRLMTKIRPISYWQYLYIGGYLSVIVAIVWFMSSPWWIMLMTVILCVIAFIISIKQSVQPLHITEPDTDNRMTRWQLLYEGYDKNELWEADLLSIKGYGNCMQLIFDTVHPIATREHVVIWQDQVDVEAWRQLKVLSRWV